MSEALKNNNVDFFKKTWRKKPPLHLLPLSALLWCAIGFGFGAYVKYEPNNWSSRGIPSEDFFRAAIGHIFDHLEGKTKDSESREHPLCHAGARLLMGIAVYIKERRGNSNA